MFNLTVVLILFFLILILLLWSLKEQYQKGEGSNIKFIADEQGQTLVELALILVLVGGVATLVLVLVGPAIWNIFSNITSGLS
jgi:Flp pilus assembly pilin Flp